MAKIEKINLWRTFGGQLVGGDWRRKGVKAVGKIRSKSLRKLSERIEKWETQGGGREGKVGEERQRK